MAPGTRGAASPVGAVLGPECSAEFAAGCRGAPEGAAFRIACFFRGASRLVWVGIRVKKGCLPGLHDAQGKNSSSHSGKERI
jgi:hypothetical protein